MCAPDDPASSLILEKDTSSPTECHGKKFRPFVMSSIIQSVFHETRTESEVHSGIIHGDSNSFRGDTRIIHGDCFFRPTLPRLETYAHELLAITERTDLFERHLKKIVGVTEVSVEMVRVNDNDGNERSEKGYSSNNGGQNADSFKLTPFRIQSHNWDAAFHFPDRWNMDVIELDKIYVETADPRRVFACEGRFTPGNEHNHFFLVDVAALALILRGAEDSRVFFTDSYRLGLSPPVWNHCLSFWESADFEEGRFVDLALSLGADCWEKIELIEKYENGERASRCYRFVYRRIDGPLTKTASNAIQCDLRALLEREMGIELR